LGPKTNEPGPTLIVCSPTSKVSRGTLLSPPLPMMVAFVVLVFLAPSRRWWGTLAVVGLCLLAVLTFSGHLAEALAPSTPEVPRAVPVASGVLRVVLCPALLLLGIVVDLMDRARVRR
jgi:hypothetical protein